MCVYFLRIESVVKMVFEVKNAVDFLPPYSYGYCFGPSSPIMQNLARENYLLAWSIANSHCDLKNDLVSIRISYYLSPEPQLGRIAVKLQLW